MMRFFQYPFNSIHNHTEQRHLKPIMVALASVLFVSGCTSDNVGKTRIIDISDENEDTDTELSITTTVAFNNSTLSAYNLTQNKKFFSTTVKKADDLDTKDAKDITAADRGLAAKVTLKKDDIPKSAYLLTRISSTPNQTSTYYDAALNKEVAIPEDKPLLGISVTSNSGAIGVLNPTPFTTLAVYRALAKVGWFYENEKLPTDEEFAKIFAEQASFISQYNIAFNELYDVFAMKNFGVTPLYDFDDLVTLAQNNISNDNRNNTVSSNIATWLVTIAMLRSYKEAFGTSASAPYFTFAHDLAKDFYDGDLDGATLNGLGSANPQLAGANNIVNNPMLMNHITNNDPNKNANNDIYEAQRQMLIAYEKSLNEQLKRLMDSIVTNASSDKQDDMRKQFDKFLKLYDINDVTESYKDRLADDYDSKKAVNSYADFHDAGLYHIAYQGVGNTTYSFGLKQGHDSQNNINLDDAVEIFLTADSLIGKYTSNNCSLIINADGVITFTKDSNRYQTFIDREINDNVYRIGSGNSQNYMLNVSNTDKDTNERRFIQINVQNSVPVSVSTAIADSANANVLTNPEASCTL